MSICRNYASCASVILLSLAVVSGGSVDKSWAGNASSPLSVTATVPPAVNVDTTPINNVTYDATGSNAQSTITITASLGTTLTIRMGQGTNPDSGSSPENPSRRMKSVAGNYLNYELTTDANHSNNWGDTTSTGVKLTGTGSQEQVPLYLRILPNQNVPAGNYTDTVQMTTDY
jgi:spore coat protein U-like protein